jgi:hypothetical protein
VLIVYFCSNDENSRSRQRDAPALANVLALFLQRKKKLDDILVGEDRGGKLRRAGSILLLPSGITL